MNRCGAILIAAALAAASATAQVSAPRQTTISVYDAGFALVSELRAVTVQPDQPVTMGPVPSRLDAATVSVEPVGGGRGLSILEQRLAHDAASPDVLLGRFLDRPVTVGSGAGARTGRLASLPAWSESGLFASPLVLALQDGSAVAYLDPREIGEIQFPDAARAASLQPSIVWLAQANQPGPQNVRVSYLAHGFRWDVSYDIVLSPDELGARLRARAGLYNGTGGRFQDAAVRLIMTEQGMARATADDVDRPFDPSAITPMRHAYGSQKPMPESVAVSLAPAGTFDVPQRVSIEDGQTVHVQIAAADQVPLTRFHVYDGVRFDRFQRNRRNDWNYGTEFHETVETHVEFENVKATGLGLPLPPGRVNLYRRGAEDSLDLIGTGVVPAIPDGGRGSIRVGPARGLRGARERIGFSEVKPLHEYEESFEIRLENNSEESTEIRVVEHLYRWAEYEIVKSDHEYKTTGPQTIEFRPDVKAGGRRSIHYTVRYRW